VKDGAGNRSAEQVTLDLRAPFPFEAGKLVMRLDAFGDGLDAETDPEADHRAHDGERGRIERDIGDERPVDLDLVEAKGAQIAQARIAGGSPAAEL
jgi:hypothetical protein